jgi:hypothetical protein
MDAVVSLEDWWVGCGLRKGGVAGRRVVVRRLRLRLRGGRCGELNLAEMDVRRGWIVVLVVVAWVLENESMDVSSFVQVTTNASIMTVYALRATVMKFFGSLMSRLSMSAVDGRWRAEKMD